MNGPNVPKTAIVTGAGSGIGTATAQRLADDGFELILIGRRREPLEKVASTLSGAGHVVADADVSDSESLRTALSGGVLEGKNLTTVFANAGIGGANEYGEDDRWQEIIDVNLTGSYNTAMECLPFLRSSEAAFANSANRNIVFTSSCLSRFGVPAYTAYCASKAGINGLTRALAVELAQERILVNSILPGWVDTEMARDGIELMADGGGVSFDTARAEQMSMVPLGRMSEPTEVAALVAFLVGDAQSSFTGQCIDINNGSFMS